METGVRQSKKYDVFCETQFFALRNNLRCFDETDVRTSQKTTYTQFKIYRTNFIDEIGPRKSMNPLKVLCPNDFEPSKFDSIMFYLKTEFSLLFSFSNRWELEEISTHYQLNSSKWLIFLSYYSAKEDGAHQLMTFWYLSHMHKSLL